MSFFKHKNKSNPNGLKRCTFCHKEYPRSKAFFYIDARNSASGGCHDCRKIYSKNRQKNKRLNVTKQRIAHTSRSNGVTYLITDGTAYKIGSTQAKTKKALPNRLKALQIGNPRRLSFVAILKNKDYEIILQDTFAKYQLHKELGLQFSGCEWFDLEPEIEAKFFELGAQKFEDFA